MYALMITFRTSIPADELIGPFQEYADSLRHQPGLISKAWIRDGDTLGGFHLFEDKGTADGYVQSDLATGLRSTEGFDDFEVRGFEVLDELSSATGVAPERPLAERA
jgi:hypothetical protein